MLSKKSFKKMAKKIKLKDFVDYTFIEKDDTGTIKRKDSCFDWF